MDMVVVVGGLERYIPHWDLKRRDVWDWEESSISWMRRNGDWVGGTGRRWVIFGKE